MSTVIDQKSETHDFFVEKVTTTLTLIETDPDTFGVLYGADYSGVARGQVQGGPIAVSGNGHWTVNPQSGVTINIDVSNYSDDSSNKLISLHITITVTAYSIVNNVTIFDNTLGGRYGVNAVDVILNHLNLAASRSTLPH